jgi:hypothetical protein
MYRVAIVRPGSTKTPGTLRLMIRHVSGFDGQPDTARDTDTVVSVAGMEEHPLEPMEAGMIGYVFFLCSLSLCTEN